MKSLRVAEKFKLKQFLKEVANPQGDPHPFQRRGEEMWPHLQVFGFFLFSLPFGLFCFVVEFFFKRLNF